MAQVMVNFRLDEEVKRSMEQACKEMGMSMTAAFTIFATKVAKEKRIPFQITAQPRSPVLHQSHRCRMGMGTGQERRNGEGGPAMAREQERWEESYAQIRRSLTAIHTAVPASIAGLCMERIRLLCSDELKDKTAGLCKTSRSLLSDGNAEMLKSKDPSILDEYLDGLSCVAEELREIQETLVPAMRAWSGGDAGGFEPYQERLEAVSQRLDGLSSVMQRFLRSTACGSGARAVQARIRKAAASVGTASVLTALDGLEARVLRNYDLLEDRARVRLESDYLQTLELTLRELGRAEQDGGDVSAGAALCLRAIGVVSQAISGGAQARREWSARSLEAEVAALERLAAMRGDAAGPGPEA